MKRINISKILILLLSFALFSCSNEDDNYKTFTGPQEALLFNSPNSVLEVTPDESSFIDVLVSSTTKSDVDRVVPVSINASSSATPNQYIVESTSVVIPAGENTATIRITSSDYDSLPLTGGVDLVLVFGDDNTDYILPNRTNHVVSIQRGCLDTKVNFTINFDGYASEITWFLTDSTNNIVASSSPYADGLTSFNQFFCLTPGTYTFVMNDSYGDGLSFPSSGSFTISLDGVVLATASGNFGSTTGPLTFVIN